MYITIHQATISIHALREEGDGKNRANRATRRAISIHALREEGDYGLQLPVMVTVAISIHALREEGDAFPATSMLGRCGFLSTPSARRATSPAVHRCLQTEISIHALREEGDLRICRAKRQSLHISIHALREEGDVPYKDYTKIIAKFLSTPSARRATPVVYFSIWAL